eukprot:1160664-Pelagomonas_calceolata.AAC.3
MIQLKLGLQLTCTCDLRTGADDLHFDLRGQGTLGRGQGYEQCCTPLPQLIHNRAIYFIAHLCHSSSTTEQLITLHTSATAHSLQQLLYSHQQSHAHEEWGRQASIRGSSIGQCMGCVVGLPRPASDLKVAHHAEGVLLRASKVGNSSGTSVRIPGQGINKVLHYGTRWKAGAVLSSGRKALLPGAFSCAHVQDKVHDLQAQGTCMGTTHPQEGQGKGMPHNFGVEAR